MVLTPNGKQDRAQAPNACKHAPQNSRPPLPRRLLVVDLVIEPQRLLGVSLREHPANQQRLRALDPAVGNPPAARTLDRRCPSRSQFAHLQVAPLLCSFRQSLLCLLLPLVVREPERFESLRARQSRVADRRLVQLDVVRLESVRKGLLRPGRLRVRAPLLLAEALDAGAAAAHEAEAAGLHRSDIHDLHNLLAMASRIHDLPHRHGDAFFAPDAELTAV
mmetsp:Transcript_125763/g.326600  ORF Transcript_125763/g.326600 Transcript_125763/m.326600 type:complete len:220 (+) Transcript_125763:571-1230(+)